MLRRQKHVLSQSATPLACTLKTALFARCVQKVRFCTLLGTLSGSGGTPLFAQMNSLAISALWLILNFKSLHPSWLSKYVMLKEFMFVFGPYCSETGRIWLRRARFQAPSSVRVLALTEFRGENSVSSSQPIICVPKQTHRALRRTHRVCPKTQ